MKLTLILATAIFAQMSMFEASLSPPIKVDRLKYITSGHGFVADIDSIGADLDIRVRGLQCTEGDTLQIVRAFMYLTLADSIELVGLEEVDEWLYEADVFVNKMPFDSLMIKVVRCRKKTEAHRWPVAMFED